MIMHRYQSPLIVRHDNQNMAIDRYILDYSHYYGVALKVAGFIAKKFPCSFEHLNHWQEHSRLAEQSTKKKKRQNNLRSAGLEISC